jgi:hypothetical protein
MTTQTASLSPHLADILVALADATYEYGKQLKDIPAGQELLRASPEEQRAFVMAAMDRLRQAQRSNETSTWTLIESLSALLRRPLPFTHDEVLALIGWAKGTVYGWRIEPHISKVIGTDLASNPRTPALDKALAGLVAALEERAWGADQRRRLLKLKEIAGIVRPDVPLLPGDVWADAAIAAIGGLEPERRALWAELLQHCAAASGSAPSAKWLKTVRAIAERLGADDVRAATLRWLSLAEQPRATTIREGWGAERDPQLMQERNVDALRGLMWLAADDSRETARALAALVAAFYRKLPGMGPRSARLGNAGIWALGQMPGRQGMAQLAALKTRVKLAGALKQIETALAAAAERAGLPADEVEELLVPTYGLAEVGLRREQLGDVTVELLVGGPGVELRYARADGKRLASAPKALKAEHGEALGELTKAAADIKAMLPAQRDRIEQLYLRQKSWPVAVWRERYLDHPLVGALARRLIWRFSGDGRQQAGIWHEGQLVGLDGRPLVGLDAQTTVALWHPLDGTTEEALAWREWLAAHEVQQPFKQAYREIYLLTDAERATRVYSNRFAAHILRQHQFNALCVARGWKNQLRLMVDDSYPPATRLLAEWGLRAEYWVEGAGDNYGADTNDTGTYLHLVTDQVRFYPIDAAQHYAHAGGGGYQPSRWRGQGAERDPVPLEEIPALALSEVLRDVDLFVGVASVGNDPNWADGGPEGRYRNYWERYAFGDLSETAKTRRAVLERLLPRLKIAARCQLSERFLHVRGDVRSYKIHLGSGNIMMEPNDQYLCIVPARGATAGADGMRFVPFEGDGTLAIILSKALLLAEDTKISDPTITRQLQR